MRVGVQGAVALGFPTLMRLDTQAREPRQGFEGFGARVFVDPKSLFCT